MNNKNNSSALLNTDFVRITILQSLSSGRIIEKSQPSYVNSPLSVVTQATGKKRLILDLHTLNSYVYKNQFKFEDWKIGLTYLSPDAFMFGFDLKSGYHHVEIEQESRRYLGFSFPFNGVVRYFEFCVLPFGLSPAPYIFTKLMKSLVTHWRSSGILIAMYLDDGFIVVPKCGSDNSHLSTARDISAHVKVDLLRAGLVYNKNKTVWDPQTSFLWLGMNWDTHKGTLEVLQRRIHKILLSISEIQSQNYVTIRKLHYFVGQIISLSPVCGNLTRLMTRFCQMVIAGSIDEDETVALNSLCIII